MSREFIKKIAYLLRERLVVLSPRRILVAIGLVLLVVVVFCGTLSLQTYRYANRVNPGIHVGAIPIGGLNSSELRDLLEDLNNKLALEGLNFTFVSEQGPEEVKINPIVIGEDSDVVNELVRVDLDKEVDKLVSHKKEGGFIKRAWQLLASSVRDEYLSLENIQMDNQGILFEMQEVGVKYEEPYKDASVEIISVKPLKFEYLEEVSGMVYDYDDALKQAYLAWSNLESIDVTLKKNSKNPDVYTEDVEAIIERLDGVVGAGGMTLSYTDPHTRRDYTWNLTIKELSNNILVEKVSDEEFVFGIDKDYLEEFLVDEVFSLVEVKAKDAKFVMEEDRVTEFQGSRPGIELDTKKSIEDIVDAFHQRTWHDEGQTKEVTLSYVKIEPNIKTSEVNDLGIEEVLGVGISDYSRSPRNRIANIRNAVNKLNGVLIKPGEEFSTIEYTKPFTIAGGYLPELVIKGDEVKPEIGGGLCQIGTTLFRTAMNSAMPITERRNHSLVVFHYDDPVNGNPGTDATVYDPKPDFKFLNDTGHYLLLQTYMDTAREELVFTLWGKSDGRKGYYTHPVVHRWIGYGRAIVTETNDLAPGVRRCQNAFRGAEASFTYTRELPSGEVIDRVFESYYRPLPQICLVGKSVGTGGGCDSGDCDVEPSTEESDT